MGIEKYGEQVAEKLQEAGKRVLIFTVEKYPGDTRFDQEPPSIDLYIIPRTEEEKAPPDVLLDEYFQGTITKNTEKDERSFVVEVESLFGIIDRLIHKKPKREPKEVWIIAEPREFNKKQYKRTHYALKLQAGPPIPLTLSLEPVQENTTSVDVASNEDLA